MTPEQKAAFINSQIAMMQIMKYGVFIRESGDGYGKQKNSFSFKMSLGDDFVSDALNYRFDFLIRMGKEVCLVDISTQKIIRKNF